jgi:hypothetical protein
MLSLVVTLALGAPVQLPVQGQLSGVDAGAQALTVRLWGEATGGSATHSETVTTTVTNGAFSVILRPDSGIFADDTLWVSVTAGGLESDRAPVGEAPRAVYARVAHDALAVGGVAAEDVIHTGSSGVLPWGALSTATLPDAIRDGYSAADGVVLTGTTFSVDPAWLDARIADALTDYEPGLLSSVGSLITDALIDFQGDLLDELDLRYQSGGTGTVICNTSSAGSTRFNAGTQGMEYCDGFGWVAFASSRASDVSISTTRNINADIIGAGRTAADGIAWRVTAPADGATSVSRFASGADFSAGLSAGDDVLLISLQGATGDANDAGNYELLRVASVTASAVTFTAPITRSYDGVAAGNQKVVLQRVPRWQNVRIQSGGTLTAGAWTALTGTSTVSTGVVAFFASGTVQIDAGGKVDVRGLGFRGGAGSSSGFCQYAYNGEGLDLEARTLEGPRSIGGGEGGDRDGSWCVLGTGAEHSAKSGGGGSHLTAGTNGANNSLSGTIYGDAQLATLHHGGAGGGSTSYRHNSGAGNGAAGGSGGGIILMLAGQVNNQGAIDASGTDGGPGVTHGGGGGGGAGGAVRIVTSTFTGVQPNVSGGSGGSGYTGSSGGAGGAGASRVAP